MRLYPILCTSLLWLCASAAFGAPITLTYDSYAENKRLLTLIDAASPIRLDGLIPNRGGAPLTQSLTFVAGATDFALSAGWRVAPNEVRTIGVNIDFLDSNNTLITSDIFSGVVNDLAQSRLVASGLIVGAEYKILFTGTAVQGGRYQIDLAAGVTPPAIPQTPVVSTSKAVSLFDTLSGDKRYGAFASGDALLIDGILGESGSIRNDAFFDFAGGTLSAGIAWLVAPGSQRTLGVNVDLFDSNGVVVLSDNFLGVINGQAFSNFVANGLAAGSYRLAFTGTATQGGRYRIDLGTNATAPPITPIPTAVPEPESWALLLLGFALTGWTIRRGHGQPSLRGPREKRLYPAHLGNDPQGTLLLA